MFSTSRARKRRLSLMAAALVAAIGLSSCASAPGSGGAGNQKDGYTFAGVFCVCFANAYVAWKKGYFEEEGVPVKDFVMTAGGSDTFAALAGGDADFGLSGLDAIMRGVETGIDVRSVATVSPEFYSLAVRSEEAGEITGAADLAGKKVAVSKVGSASWAFLRLLLREAGLSEEQVEVVQLGGIDTTMSGLRAGTVDAAVVWEPGTAQGEVDGSADVILSALAPADHQQIFGTDESIAMTLATTRTLIERDPDVVRGAVAALNKANAWMHSHTPEEIADVLQPLAEGLDHDILVAAVESTMKTMPESVDVSEAAYTASAELLKDAEILTDVPPLDSVFDCEVGKCVN